MRSMLAVVLLALASLAATEAAGEKRTFILANSADGYGIDRCLANGAECGAAAAAAYCQSKQFSAATSYRKIERDEITGAVPVGSSACGRSGCDQFIAIECTR